MTLSILSLALGLISVALLLALLARGRGQESLGAELARFEERFQALNSSLQKAEQAVRDEAQKNRSDIAQSLKNLSDSSSRQLFDLTRLNEQMMGNIRQSVENNLKRIQEDNSQKLEQMRATVDEKLQTTLEKRLGESFTQVSERLESVYKGLGEMRALASEVGNLKGVLSNIKTKGILGEIQLEKILEQMLTPEQYEKNVRIEGHEAVEFAIKLPGKEQGVVFLPIDSKLPTMEYERLAAAQEQADKELVEACGKTFEASIKIRAKEIKDKYIAPPKTTDFGIMFLPFEGLYAEVLRRPGLLDSLQNQHKIIVAGPTTFSALIMSLQMGFKTLAVEKRATEVWRLLAAVKTGMAKFAMDLTKAKSHLDDAYSSIERATRQTNTIDKKLKDVQALPAPEAEQMLGNGEDPEGLPET